MYRRLFKWRDCAPRDSAMVTIAGNYRRQGSEVLVAQAARKFSGPLVVSMGAFLGCLLCKQVFTEMGKPDGHPRKDVTIIPSWGKFSGLSSKPPNRNHELLSDLSSAMGKLEVHDGPDSAKQHKFNKIETDPTNGFRNNYHISFEPSSRRKSSNPDELDWNLSLPDTNRESYHGFAPESEVDSAELILMSCLNCYLHVMVSGAHPNCPKCGKGDCLLDMFRVSPVKKERNV
ncbi:hypothetical protein L6452_14076 [Arctium lappa]|uniref:Uncharacterized protein n=1 Tax=Arctium lappa TaxID=4217 RepID=A0ACB9CJZ4_ARCLA|nr:hypothetical protein L6452_14076 [Arctium lappa]